MKSIIAIILLFSSCGIPKKKDASPLVKDSSKTNVIRLENSNNNQINVNQ